MIGQLAPAVALDCYSFSNVSHNIRAIVKLSYHMIPATIGILAAVSDEAFKIALPTHNTTN